MKKRIREKKMSDFPSKWIYTIGFLCGIFISNFWWKKIYLQKSMTAAYFGLCVRGMKGETMNVIEKVFPKWFGVFGVTGICGLTIFGVSIAWMVMFLMGFEMGSVITCSVLQFGFKGGIFGVSLFLPQYIFYLPLIFGVCRLSYQKSMTLWKNQILFQKSIYGYIGKMLLLTFFLICGILLESFINPILVCWLAEYLKIFS